jgi:hypothetical protein
MSADDPALLGDLLAAGLTHRQVGTWTEQGYLVPIPRAESAGSGVPRRWPRTELAVARIMARCVAAGLSVPQAHHVARAGGRAELGPGVIVLVDDDPTIATLARLRQTLTAERIADLLDEVVAETGQHSNASRADTPPARAQVTSANGHNHPYAYDLTTMADTTDCGLFVHADPEAADYPGHVAATPPTGPVDCPDCLATGGSAVIVAPDPTGKVPIEYRAVVLSGEHAGAEVKMPRSTP